MNFIDSDHSGCVFRPSDVTRIIIILPFYRDRMKRGNNFISLVRYALFVDDVVAGDDEDDDVAAGWDCVVVEEVVVLIHLGPRIRSRRYALTGS